ncbi:MAG: 4-hydroxythreonine-4-phosphate dehydrogenase [Devosia sp.]
MDFIFMLTRGDKTVEDCLQVFEEIASLGIGHVGFKDVGVTPETLHKLMGAIRKTGATTYMEVVATTPESALQSARVGRDLGIDRLLGGTQIAETLKILEGSKTKYYPFPGKPVGHPTKLGGTAADVLDHSASFMAAGCAGADLLAFRATEADPIELVQAARRGLGGGYLVVAGSVASKERIQQIAAAGADAFTIGSAVFDGSYSPRNGSIRSQLKAVLADCQ